MTLPDITDRFSSDDKCRELLERLRWPDGPECPRCKTRDVVRLSTNIKLLWCADCDYQFSVTAGTIFQRFPLAADKMVHGDIAALRSAKGNLRKPD